MKQERRKLVCTIVKDGVTYRFTDIVNHGSHYSARQILDNGKPGKMILRITLEEMKTAVKEEQPCKP